MRFQSIIENLPDTHPLIIMYKSIKIKKMNVKAAKSLLSKLKLHSDFKDFVNSYVGDNLSLNNEALNELAKFYISEIKREKHSQRSVKKIQSLHFYIQCNHNRIYESVNSRIIEDKQVHAKTEKRKREIASSAQNIANLQRKENQKRNTSTDILNAQRGLSEIGLGTTPVTKIPKVKLEEVKLDKKTTVKQSYNKHILYAAGFSLKSDT